MSNVGKKPYFQQVRTEEIVLHTADLAVEINAGTNTNVLNVDNQSFVRLQVNGSSANETVIIGINAPTSTLPANDGKVINIKNTSLIDVIFKEENTGATAKDRLLTGISKELTLSAGSMVSFIYNSIQERWTLMNSSTEVISSLVVDTNTIVLSSSDLDLLTLSKKSSLIELTGGAATSLRSITAGKNGELLMLVNKTGSILQIENEDSSPLADKRIITGTGGPVTIQNNASILLAYLTDSTLASRWNIVGGTGSGGGATEQVSQTGIGVLANYPIGTALYVDSTEWKKANATASNTAEVAGLISRRLNDNLAEVSLSGEVSGVTANAFTEGVLPARGSVVFLSTTSGKLTISDVTTIGYVSKPVGIVHNVSGSTVDIMFYNQRGFVVGSANARTQINLTNNSTVTIQNAFDYDAGEIAGYVYIAATTPLRFYFQAAFTKNGAGTDYLISPQYMGNTPPFGFNITITSAGLIQVTLPNITGFVSGFINFALNAPAVGASFPLTVGGNNIVANYKGITSAYTVGVDDYYISASGAAGYTVSLPTAASVSGRIFIIKSKLNSGQILTIDANGTETIDDSLSVSLYRNEAIHLVSNGTSWEIF